MTYLLASDLDGTLIPHGSTSARREQVARFAEVAATADLRLAYVTGRHLALALNGLRRFGLPLPEAMACDVGTSVHWLRDGEWVRDEEYEALVGSSPGTVSASEIRTALSGVEALSPQPDEKQSAFKVSYDVGVTAEDGSPGGAELRERVESILAPLGRTRLVLSLDPYDGRGLLDVLPESIGKKTAVAYLAEAMGIPLGRTIYAGDSGNDTDAILAGTKAVLVGNAHESLRAELRAAAKERGVSERVYFATATDVGGVLEGLRRFGVLPEEAI